MENDFAFYMGQKVRILKTLTINVENILDMLGEEGIIVQRKYSFYGEPCYWVKVGSKIEPFVEWELDYRYIRKN